MSLLEVEVAYARPDRQRVCRLRLRPGSTIGDAIEASGLLDEFPEIDLGVNDVGVFGQPKPLKTALHDHDRVEIYRALISDPKDRRRRRASVKPAR